MRQAVEGKGPCFMTRRGFQNVRISGLPNPEKLPRLSWQRLSKEIHNRASMALFHLNVKRYQDTNLMENIVDVQLSLHLYIKHIFDALFETYDEV